MYCGTAAAFKGYLRTAPKITASTTRVRSGRAASIAFRLDKISRVGMTVARADGRVVFATSATAGRGLRSFRWSRAAAAGDYELRLTATDLAGNFTRSVSRLEVLPREAERRR